MASPASDPDPLPVQKASDVGPNIVMLRATVPAALAEFRAKVDPAWSYADPVWVSKPWEDDPHITLINTWAREELPWSVLLMVDKALQQSVEPEVTVFKQDWAPKEEHPDKRGTYDVVVIKPWARGNEWLKQTRDALYLARGLRPYHAEYQPHITVGYFQSGRGDEVAAKLREHLAAQPPFTLRAEELLVKVYKGDVLNSYPLE
jgi:2'-5' RNA ligase